jgi:NhaC family Na+:H+ antiporter
MIHTITFNLEQLMTFLYSFWPFLFFIGSILAALLLKMPLYLALVVVFVIMLIHCIRLKITVQLLSHTLLKGAKSVLPVMILLSLIMMVIPIWIQTGTIPTLLCLGFETLDQQNLVLVAFILPAILSMTIGTAMGTMSILMASLILLGSGAGIPQAIIVGAVVSGAYIGDRSALMSGSVHLNAAITETNANENFAYMMRTLLPGMLISALIYFYIGSAFPVTAETTLRFQQTAQDLRVASSIGIVSLSPIILMLTLLLFLRLKMTATMAITGLYSLFLLSFQEIPLIAILISLFKGITFNLPNGMTLSSSGLYGILPVLLVILFSTLINQLFDALHLIEPLLTKYIGRTQKFAPLSLKVGLLSFLVSLITCSQTLMIVICGQHIKSTYTQLNFDKKDLMLTIADYGIITVALIPWNINGQLIEALTGVKTTDYLPFALICILMPLMNLFYSLIRQRDYNKKIPSTLK